MGVKNAAEALKLTPSALWKAISRGSDKYQYKNIGGETHVWVEDGKHKKVDVATSGVAELKAKVCLIALARPEGESLAVCVQKLKGEREFGALALNEPNLKRWLREYKHSVAMGKDGVHSLRDGRGRPASNALLKEIEQTVLSYLLRRDISPTVAQIWRKCALIHPDTPSYATLKRWVDGWKKANPIEWAYASNPDKAKGKYLPALGRVSDGYVYRNAGWELDATVADVMTCDGKRWTIYGLIDIYSRRVVLSLEKSTSSYAVSRNLREGLLRFGIPDVVITDNGRDYTSNHIDSVCLRLGIAKREVPPFSGQKKPHIERFFGTLTKMLFKEISGYVGASVAERQALVSRRSFEQRLQGIELWKAKQWGEESFAKALLKKENAELFVEIPLSSEELREKLDAWVSWYENVHIHSTLGMTPVQQWESDPTPLRGVADVRTLDVMMGESMIRTVGKDGIVMMIEGVRLQYVHTALVERIGLKVRVIAPDDMRCVYVYDVDSGAFVCEAEDFAISHEAKRGVIKEAHKAHRKIVARALKLQKQADKAKDVADALSDAAFGAVVDNIQKQADKAKDVAKGIRRGEDTTTYEAEAPRVKRYDGLVDRFVSRMMDGSWNAKDEALALAHEELYIIAQERARVMRTS